MNLATMKTLNQEDVLRYAYAFMTTDQLNLKECSFYNPNPKKFKKEFILPEDALTAIYDDRSMPEWETFKSNQTHYSSPAYV